MTPSHADRDGADPSDSSDEDAPDSGRLRVSHETAHQSGIPPARDRLARQAEVALACLEHLELAFVESTRTEANIALLIRGLSHLSAGVGAARESNATLLSELQLLRQALAGAHEEAAALRQRVAMLGNMLEAQRRETALERELWIAQEDAFLVELMTDYERKLDESAALSERRVADLDGALAEARAERDAARSEVQHADYERDAAMIALTEPAPPPNQSLVPTTERSQGALEIGYLKLRKMPVKQKPDSSTRPLIEYAVGGQELAEERLEGARLSTRPRQR